MSKTVEDIGTLKINLLSQAQYDAEKAGGRLADDELYLTPSSGTGVSDVEVNGSSVVSGGVAEITINDIPSGGTTGQVLTKDSGTDYDVSWEDPSGGTITDVTVDGTSIVDNGVAELETVTQLRDGLMVATDKQKLDGIASGAEVNVNADWSAVSGDAQILNKPTIPTKTSDLVNDSLMPASTTNSENDIFNVSLSGNGTTTAGMFTTFTYNNGTQAVSPFSIVGNGATGKVETTISGVKTPTQNDHAVNKEYVDDSIPTKVSDLTNDSGYITSSALPTKVSDLTNDAGYITAETDPTVPSWAKQVSKPTYTASEVGALPDTTPIPSKTSDLTNDSGFITGVTSTSTPTASTIAEFDSSSYMNSTDMTSQEVSDFVDDLSYESEIATVVSDIVDYVVEQGSTTAGSVTWDYKKYHSGALEMWGGGETTLAISTATGNMYTTANTYDVAMPSFVNSCDFITAELSGGGWVDVTDMTTPPKVRFYAPTSFASATRYLKYYMKGTWA